LIRLQSSASLFTAPSACSHPARIKSVPTIALYPLTSNTWRLLEQARRLLKQSPQQHPTAHIQWKQSVPDTVLDLARDCQPPPLLPVHDTLYGIPYCTDPYHTVALLCPSPILNLFGALDPRIQNNKTQFSFTNTFRCVAPPALLRLFFTILYIPPRWIGNLGTTYTSAGSTSTQHTQTRTHSTHIVDRSPI